MPKLKLLIATHKQYDFPEADYYVPIHVGKANSRLELGIQTDDFGENISNKNGSFCELTALYWAWKNRFFVDSDYVGLVHYRRYFKGEGLRLKNKGIASEAELLADLRYCDAIVGKKRNYYIESVYNHYKNAHKIKDLDAVRQIVTLDCHDYLDAFDKVMAGTSLHLFNMFVLRNMLFESYCEWLFPILFELEKRTNTNDYDDYQKRVFGFLAERLFNVWLVKNQLKTKERGIVSLEGENLFGKAVGVLKRKFLHKR